MANSPDTIYAVFDFYEQPGMMTRARFFTDRDEAVERVNATWGRAMVEMPVVYVSSKV